MSRRNIRRLLWALVAVNLAALAFMAVVLPKITADAEANIGRGSYELATADGTPFTQASLEEGPSAVFFGFTHCPEVCPTTLGDILTWKEALPETAKMNVYFVTVDPERDTAEILSDYVGWVDGVQAVTGDREELNKALKAFSVFAARVELEDGDYTMDHTASVLLFDKNGIYRERIKYQEDFDSAVSKLKAVLGS